KGNRAIWAATGDFDHDGAIDVAASTNDTRISVLLNNGNGTLKNAVLYLCGTGPNQLQAADFNGDGWLDLFTPNDTSAYLSVFVNKGDGTGTFNAQIQVASPMLERAAVAADFDGDGKLDIATATYSVPGTVTVLLNTSN